MHDIISALSAFDQAQSVIAWLKDNGHLKSDAPGVNDLAYSYAIAYAPQSAIAAFVSVARIDTETRAAAVDDAALSKRRKLSDEEQDMLILRQERDARVREEAKTLAGTLPVPGWQ